MHLRLHPREATQIHAHFTKTIKPNLINSLLQTLNPHKVVLIYNHLARTASPADHFTFTSAVTACALLRAALKGREVHARALKSGHHSDLFLQNSLIAFYSAAADVASARRVFDGVSHPDVASWTSLIAALARNGCDEDALLAFSSMDIHPNSMTLVAALPACSRLKALKLGKSIHGFTVRRLGVHHVILDNAMLDMYMSCGVLATAHRLFSEMPERDVVSWTTIISGYAGNGYPELAIETFCVMLRDGLAAPNEATLVSVLRASALKGAMRMGKCVHACSYRSGICVDGIVGNALINLYAKCGDVGMAMRVFDTVHLKDLVTWCTIMGGMAVNGRAEEAFRLFAMMLCRGVRPDGAAFVALLSACCHAGMVERGAVVFKAMAKVYGVVPQRKHYSCMVDLYGRAGQLKEAVELFDRMPVEPDGIMWGAMMSAWKNNDGDEAAGKLLERRVLGGEVGMEGGVYALMSNALANAGRWEESDNVRELMKIKRIGKTVGFSWVEMN